MSERKHMDNDQRQTGVINWFNIQKGYGFITPDEGGKDVFVHITELDGVDANEMQEGVQVEFTVEEGPKGLQATRVTLVESSGTDSLNLAA